MVPLPPGCSGGVMVSKLPALAATGRVTLLGTLRTEKAVDCLDRCTTELPDESLSLESPVPAAVVGMRGAEKDLTGGCRCGG